MERAGDEGRGAGVAVACGGEGVTAAVVVVGDMSVGGESGCGEEGMASATRWMR